MIKCRRMMYLSIQFGRIPIWDSNTWLKA